MDKTTLSSIEDAVKDIKDGKFVIVVDDEDRENEGDLIIAAEKITPEKVNFMLKNARGVLCAPITIKRADELDLPHQVQDNGSLGPRPSSHNPCPCRSPVNPADLWTPGSHQPSLRPKQRRVAPFRPHRGFYRPLPLSRPLPCRRSDGNHERRRHDGSPAPVGRESQGMGAAHHQQQRPHRLPTQAGHRD